MLGLDCIMRLTAKLNESVPPGRRRMHSTVTQVAALALSQTVTGSLLDEPASVPGESKLSSRQMVQQTDIMQDCGKAPTWI